jgi:general secretion pathway protein M
MRLSKRERFIIVAGIALVMLVVMMEVLVFPFIEYKRKLQIGVTRAEKDLVKMVEFVSQYKTMKGDLDVVQRISVKRQKGFSLFSFLDSTSTNTGVKNNVKYMKPSEIKSSGPIKENMVEMEIDGINFEQFMKFLYEVEQSDMGVLVKRISIKHKQNEAGMIDVILQVVAYEQVG